MLKLSFTRPISIKYNEYTYNNIYDLLSEKLWIKCVDQIIEKLKQNNPKPDSLDFNSLTRDELFEKTSEEDFCNYWNMYTDKWTSPCGIEPDWKMTIEQQNIGTA